MACCVDTSAFYAYLVKKDRFNGPVTEYLRGATSKGERLFSTSFVLCETMGLLHTRHGLAGSRLFMDKLYPAVEWRWVDDRLLGRMWEIVESRGDRGFGIVDASVVAAIEEHPGSICVAVDEDLGGFGFKVLPVL